MSINNAQDKNYTFIRTVAFLLAVLIVILEAFSISLVINPNLPIFFRKVEIPSESIERGKQQFIYKIALDKRIYNDKTLRVFEGNTPLIILDNGETEAAPGTFGLRLEDNDIYIIIYPTSISATINSGLKYEIWFRPVIFSRVSGISFSIFFMALAIGGILYTKRNSEWQKKLQLTRQAIVRIRQSQASYGLLIFQGIIHLINASFFVIFMEWLFLITKPSFMSYLGWVDKITVLLNSALFLFLVALLILVTLMTIEFVLGIIFPELRKYLYQAPTAFLLACISLLLFDNFTYTVFGFGIVTVKTIVGTGIYTIGFISVFVALVLYLSTKNFVDRVKAKLSTGLVLLSVIAFLISFSPPESVIKGEEKQLDQPINIIILGADGLDSENMSVYGYDRDTTPFLKEWANHSMVSMNNFTNAAHSTGSDTALLTGKSPFTTRVLFPPDILRGNDVFEHLPGLLRDENFYTMFMGTSYYVDADVINFQNAFDQVNNSSKKKEPLIQFLNRHGYANSIYFLRSLKGRIQQRLADIFFIENMINYYDEVTQGQTSYFADWERMQVLYDSLKYANKIQQPLFAHIHLMDSHGPIFYPSERVFSAGQEQTEPQMTDFYDDTILSFDKLVQKLVQYLKDIGMYDNTMIIIYSDHGRYNRTDVRIPLIIHFPNDEYAGTIISNNTQNMDIAPTILDYIGLSKASWMSGFSLLDSIDKQRLIFSGGTVYASDQTGLWSLSTSAYKAPFFQFSYINVVQCQNVFSYNLVEKSIDEQQVLDYYEPCGEESLDPELVIREKLMNFLVENGFEISSDWFN